MELQRQEYPAMLVPVPSLRRRPLADHPQASLQPPQAVRILNDRLHHIRALNADVADWFQVRSLLGFQGVALRILLRNAGASRKPTLLGCRSLQASR
jgi:hypothetical protein